MARWHFGPLTQKVPAGSEWALLFFIGFLLLLSILVPPLCSVLAFFLAAGWMVTVGRRIRDIRRGGAPWRWRGTTLDLSDRGGTRREGREEDR